MAEVSKANIWHLDKKEAPLLERIKICFSQMCEHFKTVEDIYSHVLMNYESLC